jgi:hypothetical protein
VCALLLALSGFAAGCSGGERAGASSASRAAKAERAAAIYAAVVRQLVTNDNTFGGDPSVFKRVFVVDGALARTGESKPFSNEVKTSIGRRLRDLPPLDFVSDPDSVIDKHNGCAVVKGHGALITLGPISKAKSKKVKVQGSLFLACLGGAGATYVLKPGRIRWYICGTIGGSWIARSPDKAWPRTATSLASFSRQTGS